MTGIPGDLLKRIALALYNCGPFDSDRELIAVFVDQRIHRWVGELPANAPSRNTRVRETINYLYNCRDLQHKENALVSFLRVLADSYDEQDACRQELTALADELGSLNPYTPDIRNVSNAILGDTKSGQLSMMGKLALMGVFTLIVILAGGIRIIGQQISIGGNIINEGTRDIAVEYAFPLQQDTSYVEANNANGESVWRYQVAGQVATAQAVDLDRDDIKEVIIGVRAKEGEENQDAGKIIILSQAKERLAEFNLYDPNQSTIYGGAGSPYYWVSHIEIAELFSDGKPYIVAMGHNAEWFSSKLVILSFRKGKLELISTYWHPGFPRRIVISDLNKDGVKELVISAHNNAIATDSGNPSGVFLLRSDRVAGQFPRHYGDFPRGTHLWYYLIQPNTVEDISLGVEDHDGDQFLDVKIGLSDGCFYYITYKGELLSPQLGTACKLESELIRLE